MDSLHPNRSPLQKIGRGALIGFCTGMLIGSVYWVLMTLLLFGETARVTFAAGVETRRVSTVGDKLLQTPLVALPWGCVAVAIGAVVGYRGGWLEAASSLAGTFVAAVYTLVVCRWDGWLSLSLPLDCWFGAFVGLLSGMALQRVLRWLHTRGGESSRKGAP